jgi:GTPase involved in cell partitioning and DNA repair
LHDANILNITSGQNGSSIVSNIKSLFCVNSTFKDCDGLNGGAIYIMADCSFKLLRCIFQRCVALGTGGAIYINSSAVGGTRFILLLNHFHSCLKKYFFIYFLLLG